MSQFGAAFSSHGFDAILHDLRPLKRHKELSDPVDAYLKGDYRTVLQSPLAQKLFGQLLGRLFTEGDKNASNVPWDHGESDEISSAHALDRKSVV